MTPEIKIAPGCYKLEKPLNNPKPDRRQKNCWTAMPEFPEGIYIVRPGHASKMKTDGTEVTVEIPGEIFRESGYHSGRLSWLQEDRYPVLVANLVPADWTVSALLIYTGADMYRGETILEVLVETGKITLADLAGAVDKLQENEGWKHLKLFQKV